MTHAGIPKESRDRIGVFEDLVRISCGIEDEEDLKKDVLQALENLGIDERHAALTNRRVDWRPDRRGKSRAHHHDHFLGFARTEAR